MFPCAIPSHAAGQSCRRGHNDDFELVNDVLVQRDLRSAGPDVLEIGRLDVPLLNGDARLLAERFCDRLKAADALLVSESGLVDRSDLDRVQAAGAAAVLVGEALMRQENVERALRSLISG